MKALLLDYGHTLINFDRPDAHLLDAYHRVNQRLEQELQCEVPQAADLFRAVSEQVDAAIGRSYMEGSEQEVDIAALYREALSAVGLDPSPDTLYWVMEQEQVAWYNGCRVSPQASQMLEDARARGFVVCIVSNAAFPPEMMRAQMRHLGLFEHFDCTVFSSELGLRKPHRGIYEEALRRVGAAAEDCVFVGDRLREDIRGPRALGMRAILTHEFRQEWPAPEDGEVPIVGGLAELGALLPA